MVPPCVGRELSLLNENGDYELIKPYHRGPTTLLK
jgi:hypothetical protein